MQVLYAKVHSLFCELLGKTKISLKFTQPFSACAISQWKRIVYMFRERFQKLEKQLQLIIPLMSSISQCLNTCLSLAREKKKST